MCLKKKNEETNTFSITEDFLPYTSPCNTHRALKAEFITIHWVGPYPDHTPKGIRNWWNREGGEASAHFIIKNEECLQCWPIDQAAWHCGPKGNYKSIGIEVVPENEEGRFSEKSIATLKALLKTLPDLPLVRHYDWTGKNCPAYYVDEARWTELIHLLGK